MPKRFILLLLLFVEVFCARELKYYSLEGEYPDAKCLDGSPGGYYFDPSPNPDFKDDWIIYTEWGGWCYEIADCYERSKTLFGSSTQWSETKTILYGPMSDNNVTNPTFSNFNRVYMAYCDGASFSGNRENPISYNNSLIYYRGQNIFDSVYDSLISTKGFSSAKNVLLTGSSAGGLAVYLHADYVMEKYLPTTLEKFKILPDSGFFLNHKNLNNKFIYEAQMRNVVNIQNCSLPKNCLQGKSSNEFWKCFFAPEIYKTLETSIFILNSVYDLYQTQCILTEEFVSLDNTVHACSAIPGWYNCTQEMNFCTPSQIEILTEYKNDILYQMQESSNWNKSGNGAFLFSCYSHKAMTYPGNWHIISVDGVSMQEAVTLWRNSQDNPAEDHIYLPCTYNQSKPYNCNPTCWPSIISKVV